MLTLCVFLQFDTSSHLSLCSLAAAYLLFRLFGNFCSKLDLLVEHFLKCLVRGFGKTEESKFFGQLGESSRN